MSYVYWEESKYYRCPHCNKILVMNTQCSEGYGTNSFLMNPYNYDFCDSVKEKQGKKEVEICRKKKVKS